MADRPEASPERDFEATADRLADEVGTLLALVPIEEAATRALLGQARDSLTIVANQVAAYGWPRARFERLRDAAAAAYAAWYSRGGVGPAMDLLRDALRNG